MTKGKEESKKKITHKLAGNTLVVVIDKKSFPFNGSAEVKKEIRTKVEKYNRSNSAAELKRILALLQPEVARKKQELAIQKSKVSHQKKVVKRLKAATKDEASTLKNIFNNDPRFIITKSGSAQLKGYEVDIPAPLVQEIVNYQATMTPIEPLINFWMLCMLNPNAVARDKIFGYISRHKLVLTPSGYFVTYRMVKTTETSKKDHVYTDARTRAMKYRMGEVFRQPRSQCDEDGSRNCSRGLHTGTPEFIGLKGIELLGDGYKREVPASQSSDSYGTGYDAPTVTTKHFDQTFGNQAVICLVNPMHVVSVPNSDTRKMRSCELFFVKETTVDEVVKLQSGDYKTYDDLYHEFEVEELKQMLAEAELTNIEASLKPASARQIKAEEDKLNTLRKEIKYTTGDPVAKTLSNDEMKRIIQARLQKK